MGDCLRAGIYTSLFRQAAARENNKAKNKQTNKNKPAIYS